MHAETSYKSNVKCNDDFPLGAASKILGNSRYLLTLYVISLTDEVNDDKVRSDCIQLMSIDPKRL